MAPLMIQLVAVEVLDAVLLQLWRRSQLQLGFDSWPRNFQGMAEKGKIN